MADGDQQQMLQDFVGLPQAEQQKVLATLPEGHMLKDFAALPQAEQQKVLAPPAEQPSQQLAPGATPGASQITGISADTRGTFRKIWEDQIRPGLTAAQPGQGLKPQPTALGNAAEFAGMAGTVASQLMGPTEGAAGAEAIEGAFPSAARAGQKFKTLQGAIGNHSVAMTDRLANSLADIKDAVDTGSTLPPVVNKFVTRIADIDQGPLTYKEARQFYHNVSELSASERMATKPSDLRLIQEFKHSLGETIGNAAKDASLLQMYQSAMSEFSKAKQLEESIGNVWDVAKKAAIPTALGAAGYRYYGLLKDLVGK